jgi:hypothetical protein
MALMPLRKPATKVLAPKHTTLAAQIDQLADLRFLLRQSVAAEKALTAEVMKAMQEAKLDTAEGARSVAKITARTSTVVDVALFLETLGPKAYPALAVKIEAARELMAGADLAAISETSTSQSLRIEPKAEVAR